MLRSLFLIFSILSIANCSDKDSSDVSTLPEASHQNVSYTRDIRPIIDKKCVACHSCFDAPCQLKLESNAGLLRGATLKGAYDGSRKQAITPTRLNFDAQSLKEWQQLNFYPVINPTAPESSILLKVLSIGHSAQYLPNSKLPSDLNTSIKRTNQCAVSDHYSDLDSDSLLVGMPFSITGLTENEFSLFRGWIEQGAEVDNSTDSFSIDETQLIASWEAYLNRHSLEQQLVSRWLYEHLFLAHLYFNNLAPNRYFQLVRSYTPSGQDIQLVNTRLPNDQAAQTIYYRIRLIHGTTVHKRHIGLLFDHDLMSRIEALFFADNWTVSQLPTYEYHDRANPFVTFSAIPAKARYQFMLDHAEYFTRTFIRGPVCRGQIATDVIRDRFWVMFQDPESDLFVTNAEHRSRVEDLLGLPGQNDNLLEANGNWESYKSKRNNYHTIRYHDYAKYPALSSLSSVWDGDGHNNNALLTVFRHYDSASVRTGLIGNEPTTIWWMDYPLLERSYYELVVNFDLFGNVAHQLQTRLYFDLLRNGSEHNFLRLVPSNKRKALLDSWYGGFSLLKTHITYAPLDEVSPTFDHFTQEDVKAELTHKILTRFNDINAMKSDPLNKCKSDSCYRYDQASWIQQIDNSLASLSAKSETEFPGLQYLPELTFIRVKHHDQRTVYSLIRNRFHSNVAFIFGESLRYQPEKDTLTVYPGIAGSYPNFMFDVDASEINLFVNRLEQAQSKQDFEAITLKWGVRRTHPNFWDVLHDFTDWQVENEALEAGIFDVNRYKNL